MLSHLRFHRRAPSNPSSPGPDQPPPWDASPSQSQHPPFQQDGAPNLDNRPRSANPSLMPPTLPPISRVASSESESPLDMQDLESTMTQDPRHQQPLRSPYNGGDSGFIGGVALRNYRRGQQSTGLMPEPTGNSNSSNSGSGHESQFSRSKPLPPPIITTAPVRPPPQPMKYTKPASSFVTPTDLQIQNQHSGYPVTGKRPAGSRLTSEPPSLAMASHNGDVPKGKKGLPFLKNPMSTLLARRKTSQNAPDLLPLPLGNRKEEPSYDPRIRGTRIHDFSAPRPRRNISSNDIAGAGTNARADQRRIEEKGELIVAPLHNAVEPLSYGQHARNKSNASDSGLPASTNVNSVQLQSSEPSGVPSSRTRRSSNLELKPLPGQPPVVPPKDQKTPSVRSLSTASLAASVDAISSLPKSTPSTRTNRSRNISLSDASGKDVLSSVPRHMKSTSSRFSFDMIGAAKQEKLLEERHRQRELEKKTTEPDPHRDSRFDDFDEDGFDYDAMMDDDGLEEPIPGVNADYEDEYEEDDFQEEALQGEDPDPDNDQDNFAGFVFQRSNPTSALTSPRSAGMLSTPRDNDGKVIGFAMTKDTTPDLHPEKSPSLLSDQTLQPESDDGTAGLAIQGLDVSTKTLEFNHAGLQQNQHPLPADIDHHEDDLYYDDGMINEVSGFKRDSFEGEGDGAFFDESIFDIQDTDQYGRPIPGAFAQAQSSRTVTQDPSKRVSDSTSRMSAQSGISQSTAHTSLSTGPPHFASVVETKHETEIISPTREPLAPVPGFPASETEKMAIYQAALAAAAYKAAANGKFRRDSSPPPSDLMSQGRESLNDIPNNTLPDDYEDYDDDLFPHDNLDDYELDDDAIIAEANASALANDSDGWYGQEFGFYSAPVNQHHSRDSSNSSNGGKDFEFANGGFFGPSGVNRTISGRMVSREPNLTPITERSEYSNRNSIMSLSVPPLGSGASNLHSPGLAQLAMMADGDDNMTLSALLRLRTRAWGGSQASLVSSKDGSPRSERGDGSSSPWGPSNGNILGIHSGHGRKNSAFSILSRDSDAGSAAGSPTLTMSMPVITSPPPPIPPARDATGVSGQPAPLFSQHQAFTFQPLMDPDMGEDSSAAASMSNSGVWMKSPDSSMHPNLVIRSEATVPQRRPGIGHKHKGSADSISYIKEEDSGETRWVMERRRTADSGEVEVEREFLERGRI